MPVAFGGGLTELNANRWRCGVEGIITGTVPDPNPTGSLVLNWPANRIVRRFYGSIAFRTDVLSQTLTLIAFGPDNEHQEWWNIKLGANGVYNAEFDRFPGIRTGSGIGQFLTGADLGGVGFATVEFQATAILESY